MIKVLILILFYSYLLVKAKDVSAPPSLQFIEDENILKTLI